jgi:hypothetical protein
MNDPAQDGGITPLSRPIEHGRVFPGTRWQSKRSNKMRQIDQLEALRGERPPIDDPRWLEEEETAEADDDEEDDDEEDDDEEDDGEEDEDEEDEDEDEEDEDDDDDDEDEEDDDDEDEEDKDE